MIDRETIRIDTLKAIGDAKNEAELEAIRVAALGKKGSVSLLLTSLGTMPIEQRKIEGAAIDSACLLQDSNIVFPMLGFCPNLQLTRHLTDHFITGIPHGVQKSVIDLNDFPIAHPCQDKTIGAPMKVVANISSLLRLASSARLSSVMSRMMPTMNFSPSHQCTRSSW